MASTEARTENKTASDKEDASEKETDGVTETLGKESGPQEAAHVQKKQRQTPETATSNQKP